MVAADRRADEEEISRARLVAMASLVGAPLLVGFAAQLLAVSWKQVLELRPMDLNELVRSYQSMLVWLIGERHTLTFDLGAEPEPIRADTQQVGQVLLNLVVNARDATSSGDEIRVRTAERALDEPRVVRGRSIPAGAYVCLIVSDGGPGVPEDLADRIFDPFSPPSAWARGRASVCPRWRGSWSRAGAR